MSAGQVRLALAGDFGDSGSPGSAVQRPVFLLTRKYEPVWAKPQVADLASCVHPRRGVDQGLRGVRPAHLPVPRRTASRSWIANTRRRSVGSELPGNLTPLRVCPEPPHRTLELIPQPLRVGAVLAYRQNRRDQPPLFRRRVASASCRIRLKAGGVLPAWTGPVLLRDAVAEFVITGLQSVAVGLAGTTGQQVKPLLWHGDLVRLRSTICANRSRFPPPSAIVMRAGVLHMLVHADRMRPVSQVAASTVASSSGGSSRT